MFLPFFDQLRRGGVPVSLREYLTFLEGMTAGLATYDIDAFYFLARTCMVKDERNIDKFDRAFAAAFEGLEGLSADDVMNAVDIPEDWLRKMAEKHLSDAEKAEIEALGGFDKLMETLKKLNGSEPQAPRPLAHMGTTPKAFGSDKTRRAMGAP